MSLHQASPVLARIRPYVPTALFAALLFYFGYHALTGDRGVLTRRQRQETLAERQALLDRLTAERARLEREARLLDGRSLSRDLVEERARLRLGYADPRDIVVRFPRAPS